ncbi:MAG: 6-phosphogluconate dehydrogenase [Acidobacteriota bacterium]|jgi:6-phosphogluconate dehydrogenase|nr:6-phosphogluconate dehydrogenase [Acidobacteriota bacterium]MDT7806859.1 6-phosphogluconate dehydrogenase [Acidobacteriota bacterium]
MATPEQTPKTAQIGMIGLAVMGENLARNIERNGYTVAVYNRPPSKDEPDRVTTFMTENAGKQFIPTRTPEEFIKALERPRKIILLVKAGDPVDWTINQIKPFLEPGDIIIDGGNSYFMDTDRREKQLKEEGLNFIGSGVSGGEKGALWGPSLMPGGDREAYEHIRPIWEAIAAKVDDGPCVTYIGPGGAGHFVKMVHNGIEYGDMQLIAESYDIMRRVLGMSAGEMADVYDEWNGGELQSYLIEITAKILRVKDPETQKPLVDLILDKAGQKGTGKWTSAIALDLGIITPTINAAVDSRTISSRKDERVEASKQIGGPAGAASGSGDRKEMIAAVRDALYASKICSYAQGMNLIRAGSENWNWGINLGETARIWKGGCIIRAQFLGKIKDAYQRRADLPNLLLDPDFNAYMQGAQSNWRRAVTSAMQAGIPVPGMSASISYFDAYRTAELPLNLTQAQRDFFGSHTYERVDHPEQGSVHTEWEELLEKQG